MGLVTRESEVNSALNCRPRFLLSVKLTGMMPFLREVALFVDVTLDNKIFGGVLLRWEEKRCNKNNFWLAWM
jgi:hypothetical protein